jgi:DNA-binding NarL/FixJ family response regulator
MDITKSTVILFSINDNFKTYWSKVLEQLGISAFDAAETIGELEKLLYHEDVIVVYDYASLGNAFETVMTIMQASQINVAVLSREPSFQEGSLLLRKKIAAYGNAMMRIENIEIMLRTVVNGDVWLYPDFMNTMIKSISSVNQVEGNSPYLQYLSPREKEVALLVRQGLTNKEAASQLNVAERTIKSHLSSIFEKLGITDRLSLALLLK